MQIVPQTKIDELLTTYPELESFLMRLNPKYKKLKNPILRRTVAKIATLSQVAKIGGYKSEELVNLLREEVGQPPLKVTPNREEAHDATAKPSWAHHEATTTLDANALLDREKNPLAEVSKALKNLDEGAILAIESDFLPSPLIDTFKEQGMEVYTEEQNGKFVTKIRKKVRS